MTVTHICAHRLRWTHGVRARCNKERGHTGPHANNTLEWTTEGAAADPPRHRVINRRVVTR